MNALHQIQFIDLLTNSIWKSKNEKKNQIKSTFIRTSNVERRTSISMSNNQINNSEYK